MTDLPPDLAFGYVRFRCVLGVADTGDAGREPDAVGATGEVVFTAASPVTIGYEAGEPVTVGKQVFHCPLDAQGNMLERAGGAVGVYLMTGTWFVVYNIEGISLTSHDITVETSHTELAPLYLATYIPPGPEATPSEYSELNARLLEIEARPKITASPVGVPPTAPALHQIWVKY